MTSPMLGRSPIELRKRPEIIIADDIGFIPILVTKLANTGICMLFSHLNNNQIYSLNNSDVPNKVISF